MTKGTLLIGEDDPVLRSVYEKKFSLHGFAIRTAENGEEVLEMLEKQKPDILILDINMPIIDGFGVLEKYPRNTRDFPIILLTNFSDEKNEQRGKDLGANAFFVKSEMTIRTLLEMTEKLLTMRHSSTKAHS